MAQHTAQPAHTTKPHPLDVYIVDDNKFEDQAVEEVDRLSLEGFDVRGYRERKNEDLLSDLSDMPMSSLDEMSDDFLKKVITHCLGVITGRRSSHAKQGMEEQR